MFDVSKDAPKCSNCSAPMADYDAVWKEEPEDPETAIPDFARCKACGELHHIED